MDQHKCNVCGRLISFVPSRATDRLIALEHYPTGNVVLREGKAVTLSVFEPREEGETVYRLHNAHCVRSGK